MFLSTKSAVGFWSHFALEVVEKVVLAVYLRAESFKTRFLCVCVCVCVCAGGGVQRMHCLMVGSQIETNSV